MSKFRSYKSETGIGKSDATWLDCGANDHFMWNKSVFNSYKSISPTPVETCNGTAYIIGEGSVRFKFDTEEITIHCKHAPDFNKNVISLSKLLRSPYKVNFPDPEMFEGCHIYRKNGDTLVHTINLRDGLYPCLLYTSPSPRDLSTSRMPSSA